MTRLRTELLHALAKSPRETMRALRRYTHARREAEKQLATRGLDEALTHLETPSLPQAIALAPTLIMRLGEAFSRKPRTCLDRALTRYAFLRALGIDATFVIALDPTLTGETQAEALGHAWVEVEGEPWPFEDLFVGSPRGEISAYRVSYRHPAQRSLRHIAKATDSSALRPETP